jgi:hypothetical protein
MTSIEDKFYFGKHGHPERFSRMVMTSKGNYRTSLGRDTRVQIEGGKGWVTVDPAQYITPQRVRVQGTKGEVEVRAIIEGREIVGVTAKLVSSRHAQPDEFDLSEACWDGYEPVGTKRKDGRTVPNCVPMKNEKPERFGAIEEAAKIRISDIQSGNEQQLNKIEPILQAAANMGDERAARYLKMLRFERKHLGTSVPQAPWHRSSRPGQPERFDASSLDRKGFAAASSSLMLGKLLSEKQMPEGGWRAVETGGNALVISFEDGDVAGNFARRVASNGYSATAPVQSIGRYWNVEVKNGK